MYTKSMIMELTPLYCAAVLMDNGTGSCSNKSSDRSGEVRACERVLKNVSGFDSTLSDIVQNWKDTLVLAAIFIRHCKKALPEMIDRVELRIHKMSKL